MATIKVTRNGNQYTIEKIVAGKRYYGLGGTHNEAISDLWKNIGDADTEGVFRGKCRLCGADRNKCCC
ncbi:MAG TPA: hypothetical protein VN577_05045 [Terriglobales bacterium]|nr:hypothetical protein [Terriglobales bacterium]